MDEKTSTFVSLPKGIWEYIFGFLLCTVDNRDKLIEEMVLGHKVLNPFVVVSRKLFLLLSRLNSFFLVKGHFSVQEVERDGLGVCETH